LITVGNYGRRDTVKTNVVYFKDARDMEEVDDLSIDLVVTSPPYFNIKDYSRDGYQSEIISENVAGQIGDIPEYEAYLLALDEVWEEVERTLKPNGKLCINTPLMPMQKNELNTHYTRDIFNLNSGIENHVLKNTELYLMDIYIWNRTNPTKRLMFGSYPYPPNFYAQNTIEFISVYVKDGKPEKRSEDIKEASKLSQSEWVEYTKQVWDIPIPNKGDEAYGKHPAIMPLEMAQRLIKLYSLVGDTVLDPFLGSGTTAKAAITLKRRYIGYEINEAYRKTVEKKIGQRTLF